MRNVNDWASRISWRWGMTAIVVVATALVVAVVVALMPRGEAPTVATASSDQGPVRLQPPASTTTSPSGTTTSGTTSSGTTPSGTHPSGTTSSGTFSSSSISPQVPPVPPSEVIATTTPAVSGPGVTEPGISIWVTLQMDGSLEVMEAARYRGPVNVVTLDPVDVKDGGPAFAALVPTITHLQVTADETPVGVLESMTRATTVTLPTSASQLLLRYHLDGVTLRSSPSATGRASILIAPLSARTDSTLQSQIRIGGGPVLNLGCPRLTGDARSCAPVRGDLGVAPVLPAPDDVVLAQVDLPSPS